jgi:hypothetical protein
MSANEIIKQFIDTITSSTRIIHKLFPDSLLFGSIILYAITHNLPYGVLSLFILESSLLHRFISQLTTSFIAVTSPSGEFRGGSMDCIPGFAGSLSTLSYSSPAMLLANKYSHLTFPSYSTYIIVSVATYLGLSAWYFKDTMDEIGHSWSSRYIVALVFCALIPFLYLLGQLLTGCASNLSNIVYAFITGGLVGYSLYLFNKHLFGPEGINFLGLPYLIDKTKTNNPIYICGDTQGNN